MQNNYILITGSTGLLGQRVTEALQRRGYITLGLKHRSPTPCQIELEELEDLPKHTDSLDLVINLAGLPIAGFPWTTARKQRLRDSRIATTLSLVKAFQIHQIRCRHFISGSAIGYYGTGTEAVTERDSAGHDFSANLCRDWEQAAFQASEMASIVTVLRTGLVLAPKGGFLEPLKLSAKLGMHTHFGTGDQGQSWIDHRDWVGALLFIIDHELAGPFNLTAPNPVSQKTLISTLAQHTRKGLSLGIPTAALCPAGEMKTLFLEGQWVLPDSLQKAGYQFQYPTLEDSIPALV